MFKKPSDAVLAVIRTHAQLHAVFREILSKNKSAMYQAIGVESYCRNRFLYAEETTHDSLQGHLLREFLDQVEWGAVVEGLKTWPQMRVGSSRLSTVGSNVYPNQRNESFGAKVAEQAHERRKIIYL